MLNKILRKNLLPIILLCIFPIICFIIKYNFYEFVTNIDSSVKGFISSKIIINTLTNSMKIITNIGSVVGVLTIFIISIIVFKDKTTRIMLLSNITLIGILSLVLKTIFSRERPLESIIKMPTSYSFPSGHTFFAVGFYGLIVYFISKSNIKKSIKTLLIIISSLLIFLIGFSRIYLGVHHFTDVIGGLIYGLLILIISINTYQILKEEKR